MPHNLLQLLPGREPEEEIDFEARSAIGTLFEAEEIKDKDLSFLLRVSGEVQRKQGILSRLAEQLPDPEDTVDVEELGPDEEELPESSGSRMEDFFARLGRSKSVEDAKTDETPAARRRRLEAGARRPKTTGNSVLTKFT